MRMSHVLGLSGSAMLAIGVFLPILSLPIVGSMNYFRNGEGDGTILLILALVSAVLTLRSRYEWLLTTGISSLAILIYTFVNLRQRISGMNADLESRLAGNPFKGLADVALQSVEIQWGWIVLVVGSALLVAAAARRNHAADSLCKCPFCAERIQPDARICKHCRSDVATGAAAPPQPLPAQAQFPRRVVIVTALLVMGLPLLAWISPIIPVLLTECDWRAFECA